MCSYFISVPRNILQWNPKPGDHKNREFPLFLNCIPSGEWSISDIPGRAGTVFGLPGFYQTQLPTPEVTLFWVRVLWKALGDHLLKNCLSFHYFLVTASLAWYDRILGGSFSVYQTVSGTWLFIWNIFCKWTAQKITLQTSWQTCKQSEKGSKDEGDLFGKCSLQVFCHLFLGTVTFTLQCFWCGYFKCFTDPNTNSAYWSCSGGQDTASLGRQLSPPVPSW